MAFRKYDHVERLGHDEVEGLTIGDVYVFPKLDGTNSSIWFDDGGHVGWFTQYGSRTRTLTAQTDNAGFFVWAEQKEIQKKLWEIGNVVGRHWTIYGEWLVPHTLKTYREDAWRKFYVFDIYDNEKQKYLHYKEYEPIIKAAGLDVIEPLCIFTNPSDEQLQHEAEQNTYLILDGAGCGEGIVMKNYLWENNFGRQPWAKLVRNEFKEENKRAFGTTEKGGAFQVEAAIAEEYVTLELVNKTRNKIVTELMNQDITAGVEKIDKSGDSTEYFKLRKRVEERHRGQLIPRLLGTVYYELVNEELWDAVKTHKDPTIDFKRLKAHSILWTKKYAADLF